MRRLPPVRLKALRVNIETRPELKPPEMRIPAFSPAHGKTRALGWRLLLASLCWVLLAAPVLRSEEIDPLRVAILVSRDIRPYIEAVEGMSDHLSENAGAKVQVFSLEKFKGKARDALMQDLASERFALVVTVGPEAAGAVLDNPLPGKTAWLYSMVLTPPAISGQPGNVCGIPLDIPPKKQIEVIRQGLNAVKRIGLLYDPRYNSEFFIKAAAEASSLDLRIVPLRVSSKKEIPAVLKQNWENIDALWLIPDQTVISESIVQYIIKEAVFKRIPAIGYNRFFYESGAALAFVFDYEELGRQTGRLAAETLRGKFCERESPVFHAWLNIRVIEKLGISVPARRSPPIEAGP